MDGDAHSRPQLPPATREAQLLATDRLGDSAADADRMALELQQRQLRQKIVAIQQDAALAPAEKARRIQDLMTGNKHTHKSSAITNRLENKLADFAAVTDEDRAPMYNDKDALVLGCEHYQRGCKVQAPCCGKWFVCRFCHDQVSDHAVNRKAITTMMCMSCATVQPSAQACINKACGKELAVYHCAECKFWDADVRKNIYHCSDCGICRIGKGLEQDYFHCDRCNVCMAIGLKGQHKCIERNLESDCPICGEFLFTSTSAVMFMPCGHSIHYKCHQEYIQTSYQCPTCFKSLANMRDFFRRIDAMLAQHKMPAEYDGWVSHVLCNDCEEKTYSKFHFMYHKCADCGSYNTKVLRSCERSEIGDADVYVQMPGVPARNERVGDVDDDDDGDEDKEGDEATLGDAMDLGSPIESVPRPPRDEDIMSE